MVMITIKQLQIQIKIFIVYLRFYPGYPEIIS